MIYQENKVCQYQAGALRFRVPASVLGEAFRAIKAKGLEIVGPTVVDEARSNDFPELHEEFFSLDSDATFAQRGREEHARELIRNVVWINLNDPSAEPEEYVSIVKPDVGRCYVSTSEIACEPDLELQVREDASTAFRTLRARYSRLAKQLPGAFAHIDAGIEMIDQDAEKRRQTQKKAAKKARRPVAAKV